MSRRRFVFALTEREADALIELGAHLEGSLKRNSPLDRAGCKMDEQKAKQNSPWERCEACEGSGWVEGAGA